MLRVWALVIAGLGVSAHAGQVHHEPVPLERVVQQSELIVVVSAADPATERLTLAIPDHPEVEPFIARIRRVNVEQIVHDPHGLAEVGSVLAIGPGSLESMVSLHTRYHVEGIRKSPILPIYESPIGKGGASPERWIALVRRCRVATVSLCFTVHDATEKTDALPRIEQLRSGR